MPTKTRPTEVPPAESAGRPPEPTSEQLAMAQSGTVATAAVSDLDRPTFEPPGTAAGAVASAAAAGWLTNKHVLMLWQTTSPMDNWAYYDGGIGWKPSTQSGDVAARGMGVLTAGARLGGGIVHAYEGAGGAIDAIYLW
ncbi:MAG TPA: hypothetical protein VLD86_02530 [Ilumatobacteraceae bacterium]|nr:hypothetical protein [Ilumatobacteraceae bacterium]